MDNASLKRIGQVLGAVVCVGFCLYEAFCGLVLGRVSLTSGSNGFLGAGLHEDTYDGTAARVVGLIALLLGTVVALATVRSLRDSS